MAIFAKVVESRSFSEAARRLRLSKGAVSKAVAHLEQSMGARLLHRTTRAMSTTEAGAEFYAHCARIVEEYDQAKLTVGRFHSEPTGLLRVSASVAFGTLHIAPTLPEFLKRHPGVRIDMSIGDRIVDLAEEGFDVAIRITKEPAPNLVARRLATVNRKIVATPQYLKARGTPRKPEQLVDHNCLSYTYFNPHDTWRLRGPDGDISVPVSGNLRLNDDEALSAAVMGGLGLALLPTFLIGRALKEGKLKAVLSDYVPSERHIFAVYLPNRHLPAKVRAFIDFLAKRFSPRPYWD